MARNTVYLESTTVPVERTQGQILALLHESGHVRMAGIEGSEIRFTMPQPTAIGGEMDYRITVDPKRLPLEGTKSRWENRERIAWRQALMLLKAQLAFIETKMVAAEQAFMGFGMSGQWVDGERMDMYQAFTLHRVKQLEAPKEKEV